MCSSFEPSGWCFFTLIPCFPQPLLSLLILEQDRIYVDLPVSAGRIYICIVCCWPRRCALGGRSTPRHSYLPVGSVIAHISQLSCCFQIGSHLVHCCFTAWPADIPNWWGALDPTMLSASNWLLITSRETLAWWLGPGTTLRPILFLAFFYNGVYLNILPPPGCVFMLTASCVCEDQISTTTTSLSYSSFWG